MLRNQRRYINAVFDMSMDEFDKIGGSLYSDIRVR